MFKDCYLKSVSSNILNSTNIFFIEEYQGTIIYPKSLANKYAVVNQLLTF